jgi:hypothetical protein
VFPVCKSFRPQVLPITHQKVESEEAWLAPMKEEVIELRSSTLVETDNLSIEHSFASARRSQFFPKLSELIERVTVTGD